MKINKVLEFNKIKYYICRKYLNKQLKYNIKIKY